MLGRGLESLIPKKGGSNKNPPQDFSVSPEISERLALFKKSVSEPERARYVPVVRQRGVSEGESQAGGRHAGEPNPVFSRTKPAAQESIFHIEIEKISSNPFQPRKEFDRPGLEELARSIREFGILQPLVVSKIVKETEVGAQVEYQLIAGERRLMAAKLLGLERVPAIVKKVDEHRTKLEMALIENLQRSDLNPLETAKAYARLQDEFGLVQREIAARVGKSREVVANTLRLLNLPLVVQEALAQGRIGESQARTLLGIENPEEQERVFKSLLEDKLSVRELKARIQRPAAQPDPQSHFWENKFEGKLGVPVKIRKNRGQGRITIQFRSEDEWEGILDKVLGEED